MNQIRQGDVLVVAASIPADAVRLSPGDRGYVLAEGEATGHAHAEIRRVMIQRYGQSQYLLDSGAKVVHTDDYGTLYRQPRPNDSDLVMVKVVNASRETDGSFKDYFLRVPPEMTEAKQAVAWTFGAEAKTYQPEVQS